MCCIHPAFVSCDLVQTNFIMNGSGGVVVGLGNDEASDLSPLLEIIRGIQHSVHVQIEPATRAGENQVIPLVGIKFAGGVIGRIKVRMHDTACRNVNAGRIVVIGLNSQLPAVGRIDPVIIMPILSIVRGSPDPTG